MINTDREGWKMFDRGNNKVMQDHAILLVNRWYPLIGLSWMWIESRTVVYSRTLGNLIFLNLLFNLTWPSPFVFVDFFGYFF